MVQLDFPLKPSECPIMQGRTGSKLPVEGLCNHVWAGVGLSLKGNWNVCCIDCSGETSSALDFLRSWRFPERSSTGLALPGKSAAHLALWWRDAEHMGEVCNSLWHNQGGYGVFGCCWEYGKRLFSGRAGGWTWLQREVVRSNGGEDGPR